jgi:hypothetical protein
VAALITVMAVLLTLEVFAPGVGLAALSVVAVVATVWTRPRGAVVMLVALFALQDLLANLLAGFDPIVAGAVRGLDEVGLLCAGLRVAVLFNRGDRTWFGREDWTFAIWFLAAGLISSVLHGGGLAPTVLGFAFSCKFFGFILFASSVPWKEGDADRAISIAIWTLPVLFAIGFIGYLSPDEVIEYLAQTDENTTFARGDMTPFMAPFSHPGVYGWAMAVGALAAVARLLGGGSRGAVVGLVTGVVGAILSLRRRPLVAVPLALCAVLVRLPARQRLRIFAIALVVGGLLAWVGRDFVRATIEDTMTSYIDDDAAENSARGLLILGSLELGSRHLPLGVGFGRYGTYPSVLFYSDLYDELGMSSIHGLAPDTPYYIMDTYWPHIFAETGALGLLAMAAFMWRIWRRVGKLGSPEGRLAALLLAEGLVESLAGPVFDTSLQCLVIAIPIGMALRSIHLASPSTERP